MCNHDHRFCLSLETERSAPPNPSMTALAEGNSALAVKLLRRTTHGMPILSAATTPVWLPATSTQLHKGTSAYSAPARNVTTTFCKLGKVTQLSLLQNLKVKLNRHCFKCYICLGFSTSIKFENFNIKDMKRTAN